MYILPDYRKNNLINLISSILHGFGIKSRYPPLKDLVKEVRSAQNVVLLVLDGMGADSLNWLKKENKGSFLAKHHLQNLNSLFPSATTAVITTFYTGLAPGEHGLVGWYLYLKEFQDIVAILPFRDKDGNELDPLVRFDYPPSIFNQLKVETHLIMKKELFQSPYNQHLLGKATPWRINNFNGLLAKIKSSLNYSPRRKYIYAYWGELDTLGHHYGKESRKSRRHLLELDQKLERWASQLKKKNTLLLITADHGQISTSQKRTIILDQHPPFIECLQRPLGGDSRVVFCHVRPGKEKMFERYVKRYLKKYCSLHPAQKLVKKNYFGLFKAHPQLFSRLGHYVLLAKENYAFREHLPEKGKKLHIGNHSGLSPEEMIVPLIKMKL